MMWKLDHVYAFDDRVFPDQPILMINRMILLLQIGYHRLVSSVIFKLFDLSVSFVQSVVILNVCPTVIPVTRANPVTRAIGVYII